MTPAPEASRGAPRTPAGDDASAYARRLLAELGLGADLPAARSDDALAAWARSGAMALTGRADGPPCLVAAPVAAAAEGALRALAALAASDALAAMDGALLLGERAACAGLVRRGRVSPGGSARLLRARDGWIVASLAREEDHALLPAWLDVAAAADTEARWARVVEAVRRRPRREVVARGRLLGLPVAPVALRAPGARWVRVAARGTRRVPDPARRPLVVDLSALWAGPLATHLLGLAGARVVKVESATRPDGARRGPADFFDLLHGGHDSVVLDLAHEAGPRRLRALCARADVVVESARPRALRQLGVDADALVGARPGLVWLSLTGYGRRPPADGRVAFGDDAAAAAGLAAAVLPEEERPLFCGDAVADPLAGVHGALAAFAAWRAGGGVLLDVALCQVARHVARLRLPSGDAPERACVREEADGTVVAHAGRRLPVAAPRRREPAATARPLGADTAAVLAELAPGC